MKRMKLKKRRKIFKIFLYPIFIFLIYECLNFLFLNAQLTGNNEELIQSMLQDSNAHFIYERENNLVFQLMNWIGKFKLKQPVTILQSALAYEEPQVETKVQTEQTFSYITNTVIDKPRVYIYNTHPTEGYVGEALEQYSVPSGVMMATYLLQDTLNEMGIATIVEERSAATYIKEHNLEYEDSYVATREFLQNALKKYDGFDLIIDLHRDGIPKNVSTTTIDGKEYAKVMFVMNPNYNIDFAKKISEKTNELYPGLSRGIYDKHRHNFNQDLNPHVILLELGGENNTVEEVVNTVKAMANVIKEIIK